MPFFVEVIGFEVHTYFDDTDFGQIFLVCSESETSGDGKLLIKMGTYFVAINCAFQKWFFELCESYMGED
jgi:hypothetical protein